MGTQQAIQKPDLCVWMQAGVVPKKICKNDYDCIPCRYDRALQKAVRQNKEDRENGRTISAARKKIVHWLDRLKELPVREQPCVYHLKGRIDFRSCTHEFRCRDCEFDQYFYDQYRVNAVVQPVDVAQIEGFKVPQGFYMHYGHTWVKIEKGANLRIGLDDFALGMLGELDRIEAPLLGKEMAQDRPDITVFRGENRATFLSPVSGVVTAVNPRLQDEGPSIQGDPYTRGWIAMLHPANLREDLKNLMIGDESQHFFKKEVQRLYALIEETAGPLAADGGHLSRDVYGNMPQIGWKRLTQTFLHTK